MLINLQIYELPEEKYEKFLKKQEKNYFGFEITRTTKVHMDAKTHYDLTINLLDLDRAPNIVVKDTLKKDTKKLISFLFN